MKKYKYNINNLDCANCAREIEEALNKNTDFKNVSISFATSKLTYESDKDFSLKELNNLIKKIEPDASISKDEVENKKQFHLWILVLALIIVFLAYFLNLPNPVKITMYIISYALLLYRTTINAIKLLIKSKKINENALITISCIGALLIGEVIEGTLVITLYTIGKILEEKAINKSRKSIKDLLDIKQPYANIKIGNSTKQIDIEQIKIGDLLVVKKGEKIPVDGVIVEGNTLLDTSALTGESELAKKNVSDTVLSGCINTGDIITIKATSLFEDSTVAKILELLENASEKKAKTETIISKISEIYTPVVVLLALITIAILPLVFNVELMESIHRGLTFLVISCPCAIAISIPLSYFTGIGVASKSGILVKGSNYLDNLSNIKNIIFDKTGTLTNGAFSVTNIEILDDNYTKEDIINIITKGESLSTHPIASSIVKLKQGKIDNSDVLDYKEIEGKGITYMLNGKKISIGNKSLCNCKVDAILHLNIENKHVASITINDGIKENAKDTITKLKKLKINTYMFTGDKKDVAINIAKKLEIDNVKYEMLPTDKYEQFEKIANKNEITAFVGDGINDAPVLKRADIGISMGGVGTDSAIEASDIVLMRDDLSKIKTAVNIAKVTDRKVKESIIFALVVKAIVLLLGVFGLSTIILAVFADVGVTLLVILNVITIFYKKIK